jgi:glycosyltransferase involved in cell wall biosynthesis
VIDVCLILEGTYPFVAGGVSTWIHQLVSSMPDLRFSILYISPFPNPAREMKYKVPPNVLDIQDIYLHDYDRMGSGMSNPLKRRRLIPRLEELHEDFFDKKWSRLPDLLPLVREELGGLTVDDIMRSKEAWNSVTRFYARYGERVSFLDFFWTWRSIYLPLLQVLKSPIPRARLYHTVSTGYAGLVSAVAKQLNDKRVLLTEHGVYTHERLLEISQATWIHSPKQERFRIKRELPFFKRFWLGLFRALGGISYEYADKILTLYEGNRTREILDGAAPEKIEIVPNGINLDFYRELARPPETGRRKRIAFIGRVVPIKDVKTFLQAAKIVLSRMPEAEFLILGPTEEEPDYTRECRQMADTLKIRDSVDFAGKVDLKKYLPEIDLVVLTSLSEAQPFVILEANAAGIPVVATNVGACRELCEGRLPEDRRLGASGIVTDVAAPEQTAAAIFRLLGDPRLWKSYAQAGKKRVFRYYDERDLISRYLNIYEQNVS